MDEMHYGFRLGTWTSSLSEYWSEERARKAHATGEQYEAQFGTKEKPLWYVLINTEIAVSQRFDGYGNVWLSATYQRLKDGNLFRKTTSKFEMAPGNHVFIKTTCNIYDSKKQTCIVTTYNHRSKKKVEKLLMFSLEDNIIPSPEFGNYDALIDENIKMYF
ncbi:MAG: hypothetical protein ABJA67_08965 [Chthonomonadales bacterium]